MRAHWARWGVFNLVATGGFLLQIGTIAILTRKFGWPALPATIVGFEVAALHNFVGHSAWTFRETRVPTVRALVVRYVRYELAKTAALGANAAVTVALIWLLGAPVELANLTAVLVCALPNYRLVQKAFTGVTSSPSRQHPSRPISFVRSSSLFNFTNHSRKECLMRIFDPVFASRDSADGSGLASDLLRDILDSRPR